MTILSVHNDMSVPTISTLSLGAVHPVRLARSMALVVSANGLTRTPKPLEIFSADFTPPLADGPTKRL